MGNRKEVTFYIASELEIFSPQIKLNEWLLTAHIGDRVYKCYVS